MPFVIPPEALNPAMEYGKDDFFATINFRDSKITAYKKKDPDESLQFEHLIIEQTKDDTSLCIAVIRCVIQDYTRLLPPHNERIYDIQKEPFNAPYVESAGEIMFGTSPGKRRKYTPGIVVCVDENDINFANLISDPPLMLAVTQMLIDAFSRNVNTGKRKIPVYLSFPTVYYGSTEPFNSAELVKTLISCGFDITITPDFDWGDELGWYIILAVYSNAMRSTIQEKIFEKMHGLPTCDKN